jgi:hypothetical protein
MSAEADPPVFGDHLERIRLVVQLLVLSGESSIDKRAIAAILHPQMHSLAAPGVAPARSYENREQFLEYFPDAVGKGIQVRPDASEIKVLASGSVLAAGSLRVTTPAGTDTTPAWFVYTFREGLIDSLETYLDQGLAEESLRG